MGHAKSMGLRGTMRELTDAFSRSRAWRDCPELLIIRCDAATTHRELRQIVRNRVAEINVVAKPILQALVLADHVYTDKHSGKKVIAGTFNHLSASQFPAQFSRSTWAFICLTDVQGKVEVNLRYVDLSTNELLMETKAITVTSRDPLASPELMVEVPPFPMPHEGVYAFEVHVGGEMLGSVRVQVSKRESGGQR